MVIKVIGSAMVFVSCTLAGFFVASEGKYRAEDLLEMKRGLLLLKSDICYSSRPLYEALIDISQRVDNTVSEIFEDSGRLLKSRKVSSASEAWESTIKNRMSRTFYKKEDIDAFISFGKALGGEDKDCQKANIDMVINYIDSKSEELMKKNLKDSKLLKSAGVLCGILIVAVLF